ncbi:hypothetical protein AB833_02785 [Chromatiales bacterium (ex Bugula neritina AB1)]|nr:hypothetical protein AB833_02785 [Chromatiales bacterium (ex Bugula neritina AB1)]
MKLLVAVSFALLSTTSYAAGDAAAGKSKSSICAACHGANGVSLIPNYPNLAGQKSAYLVAQLKAFKSGARKGASSAIMAPMAAGLSDADMANLAAYYSSLPAAK